MIQYFWIPDAKPPGRTSRLAKLLQVLGRKGDQTLEELGSGLYTSPGRALRSVQNLIDRGFPIKIKNELVSLRVPKKYYVTKAWVRKFKTWRL